MTRETRTARWRRYPFAAASVCAVAVLLWWKVTDEDRNFPATTPQQVEQPIQSAGVGEATEASEPDTGSAGPESPDTAAVIEVAVTHMTYPDAAAQTRQLEDAFYQAFIAEMRSIPGVVLTEHPATDISALAGIITPVQSLRNYFSSADLADSEITPFGVAERPAERPAEPPAELQQNQPEVNERALPVGVSNYAYRFSASRLEPIGSSPEEYDFRLAVGTTATDQTFTLMIANATYFTRRGSGGMTDIAQVPVGSILASSDMNELAVRMVRNLSQIIGGANTSAVSELQLREFYELDPQNAMQSGSQDVGPADVSSLLAQLAEAPGADEASVQNRVRALRMLNALNDDRVIAPVSELLLYELDERVRLAAVQVLGRYRDDASAIAALSLAAQADASPEVRRQASWLSLDDPGRVESIASIIRNPELSDAERLAPIYSPLGNRTEAVSGIESDFNFDPGTVQVISDLVKRHEPIVSRFYIVTYLAQSHPDSFVPLMIDRLQNDPGPRLRINMIEGLGTQLAEPGVREALERAARTDAEELVRISAASALEGRPANPASLRQTP